MTTSLKPQL